jgi:hypothetical protein
VIRFGIVTREQLMESLGRAEKLPPAIAFPLVASFAGNLTELEEGALAVIYGEMPAGRTIKLTWRERLRALDDLLLAEIERRFPAGQLLRLHDMAASNAITSVDLFGRLAATGRGISFVASDFYDALEVVTLPDGWRVVFDAEGEPLQMIGRRMVLSAAGERKRFPINRLVHAWMKRRTVPRARALLAEGRAERIALFHPEALALAARDSRFELRREDVFSPRPGPYEVVKLVSFLSPHRYGPETARRALRGVADTLTEGGVLALGRTEGASERIDASLFAKEDGRFVLLTDLRSGYSYKDLVLEMGRATG